METEKYRIRREHVRDIVIVILYYIMVKYKYLVLKLASVFNIK